MVSIKSLISILGAATLALASPIEQATDGDFTLPSQSTKSNILTLGILDTTTKNDYPLVCNDGNLNRGDIILAAAKMEARGGACNVNGGGAHWMDAGNVRVTGYPFMAKTAGAPCNDAARAVRDIERVCGERGGKSDFTCSFSRRECELTLGILGSAQVGGNLNLVVHVLDHWL